MRIKNTAIITGASRGIGRACALELSSYFEHIVLNSASHKEALLDVANEVEKNGAICHSFCGDIGDFSFVETMVREIHSTCPPVELLVNNAGISYVGLLTDMSFTDWDHILTTNLTSVFNTCNLLVPQMVHNQSGHIINISSMWGLSGASCEVAYSATKGGVNAFTKALAKELAPSHVRVNAIACGAIDTSMNDCFSPEEMQTFCEDIPACRLGKPEEIAKFVLQLYESPCYLTGEVIKIDGGYL